MDSFLGHEDIQNENVSSSGGKHYNPLVNKPNLVYHADWSSNALHRWSAKATLGADRCYSASESTLVGDPTKLVESLRADACESEGTRLLFWGDEMFNERHYKPAELAKVWGWHADKVRDWFRSEPGVLIVDRPK
jgi:hypothetical protein